MGKTFADIVEGVRQLSAAEKEELQELLHKFLVEERRREIRVNADASLGEYRQGKLQTFTDADELMKSLSHD